MPVVSHTLPLTISIPVVHLTGVACIPQIMVLERGQDGHVSSALLSPANSDIELAQTYQRLGEQLGDSQ